jgi:hypothetical protein
MRTLPSTRVRVCSMTPLLRVKVWSRESWVAGLVGMEMPAARRMALVRTAVVVRARMRGLVRLFIFVLKRVKFPVWFKYMQMVGLCQLFVKKMIFFFVILP